MFKYTASPEVLRKYWSIEKHSSKPWNDRYYLALHITETAQAYFACGNFWRHYQTLEFYSPVKRKHIPVNGVLIDAAWFVETKV